MSIASEIKRIQTNISNTYDALENLGATIPVIKNSDNIVSTINTIPATPTKYNCTVDNFIGNINSSDKLLFPTNPTSLVFNGVKDIDDYALYYKFCNYSDITSVSFPDLENVTGYSALVRAFYCPEFNGLLTSVSLPKLKTVTSGDALYGIFGGQISLKSLSLPELTTATGGYCLANLCYYCENLSSISLPKLENIQNYNILHNAFTKTKLTSLSFPALKSTSFGNYTSQFDYMLYGVNGCTVHFPSNLQSIIGSWSSVTAGFSGTNTIVLFDLPATE